ncbi:MAG: hypothetical protein HY225_02265 [Candidatus Vogelbacteria bacterium]|nr:hypothetical protein [Candidatus Vogelbacteria bacterium]
MKNKISIGVITFALILFNGGIISANKALAYEERIGQASSAREVVEQTEEKVLGSEKHSELEKMEPSIDSSIKRNGPVVLVGISLLLFATTLYLKFKKKKV